DTYIAPRQIPFLDLYFSFTGGPMLEHLRQRYSARRPCALYCALDANDASVPRARLRWDLGYLGTYSADRQPALERLLLEPARRLPDRRFVVAGPQYPTDIAWPANVDRIEHLPPADHAGFYAAQRFTLNITRAAMVQAGWSPSVRLFEAAGCGTPVISDRWAGLLDIFPDAVIVADDTDDVVRALTEMPGDARRGIGATARALVLDRHTGTARARELLLALETVAKQ
ncbi:MAG: glycosyltransferase, partial [Proteobacteria bacterium]|nr:glycosyltransferase [Pseudomonadota bacterium]